MLLLYPEFFSYTQIFKKQTKIYTIMHCTAKIPRYIRNEQSSLFVQEFGQKTRRFSRKYLQENGRIRFSPFIHNLDKSANNVSFFLFIFRKTFTVTRHIVECNLHTITTRAFFIRPDLQHANFHPSSSTFVRRSYCSPLFYGRRGVVELSISRRQSD